VIPLMPGFEGDICGSSAVLKAQIKYQIETISKGNNSLFGQLEAKAIEPSDYIRFFGLRNHQFNTKTAVQEMIYVHSKLMIVDDRKVVIGSANINDRSMLGTRDSEIACLIEDQDLVESTMADEPFLVGKFAHEFRQQIFAEHYGHSQRREETKEAQETRDLEEVKDPMGEDFWDNWNARAKKNSAIYHEIWRAEPAQHQTKITVIKEDRKEQGALSAEEVLEKWNSLRDQIEGHLVEYPTSFLIDQPNLGIRLTD
jgi:phospholipase D1/2